MAQSKRSSNTQAKTSGSGSRGGKTSAAQRASRTTASPQHPAGRHAAPRQERQPEPATPYRRGGGLLDIDARHDIGGVAISVIGVALLIAVLTPTSGLLTQAVSQGLHAVFGLGAFVVPVALLVWGVSFFVHLPSIQPGRVAAGLGLIALAVIALVGIFTPGADADPSRLFNPYVLADRGGYIGNGLAWLLLTLTGKVVGVVVLCGIALAGLMVIGFNAGMAVQSCMVRAEQRRAASRLRSQERAAAAARGQQQAWFARAGAAIPADYAPTTLFDPNSPLAGPRQVSQGSFAQHGLDAAAYGAPNQVQYEPAHRVPTTLVPPLGSVPTTCIDPSASVVRNSREASFEYADQPVDLGGALGEVPDALSAQAPSLQEPLGTAQPFESPVHHAATSAEEPFASTPARAGHQNARRRAVTKRIEQAQQWWDPADDWKRDEFDPDAPSREEASVPVPGVLPGAPVDAPASAVFNARMTSDTVVSDTSADTTDIPEAVRDQHATPKGRKRNATTSTAASSKHVELPWEAEDTAPVQNAPKDNAPKAATPSRPQPAGEGNGFVLPDPAIMQRNERGLERTPEQRREAQEMGVMLQTTLNEFGVKAQVAGLIEGPTCTTYKVSPGEGVRVNRFTSLEDDIARALAKSSVRIYAPVPGTSYVGIEVPNTTRQAVFFGDVLPYVDGGPLDFAVGLDANGKPVHVDLAKLPHLLVAGTTGSGKSVCVNSIVMSFLMRDTPEEVRLIMVDPKQVEFKVYDGIPHLIMPVITDMRQAAAALQWGVTEMDRRYRIFSNMGVRDLKTYNGLVENGAFEDTEFPLQKLPSIVIVIDELADLMMVAKKDVEASIVRIAQLGRACGIHLIMATQTPRADIVTGLIRANVACRIGLKVAKGTDSQIAIDQTGAEKLLGNGDMLFLQTAWGDKPRRIQGCYLKDEEIAQVVSHLKEQTGDFGYTMAPLPGSQLSMDLSGAAGAEGGESAVNDDDPLAWQAAQIVVENQLGSTSMLQRRLKVGYARAGRVMDMLEEMGVVGPARGSKPRDVLIRDLEELATLRGECDGSEGEY